jgi:hypothetical protein
MTSSESNPECLEERCDTTLLALYAIPKSGNLFC